MVAPTQVRAGGFEDCADAKVVAVGAGLAPGETRFDLLKKNAAIFGDLIPRIATPERDPAVRGIPAAPNQRHWFSVSSRNGGNSPAGDSATRLSPAAPKRFRGINDESTDPA